MLSHFVQELLQLSSLPLLPPPPRRMKPTDYNQSGRKVAEASLPAQLKHWRGCPGGSHEDETRSLGKVCVVGSREGEGEILTNWSRIRQEYPQVRMLLLGTNSHGFKKLYGKRNLVATSKSATLQLGMNYL